MLGALFGGNQDRDQTAATCWATLPFAFKSLFLLALGMFLIDSITGWPIYYLSNIVFFTVGSFQIWRLLTSFLTNKGGIMSLLNLLISYYLLYGILPELVRIIYYRKERKKSTVFIYLEVIVQTLTANILICLVGYPLIAFGIA